MAYIYRGTRLDTDDQPAPAPAPKPAPTPKQLPVHGTYARYMRHKRAGQNPCTHCLAGYAQYMRDYRAQKQAA